MKLKTRLIISFCLILFVPIILGYVLLGSFRVIQMNQMGSMYSINGNYEYFTNSMPLLNYYISTEVEQAKVWVEDGEDLLDAGNLKKLNEKANSNNCFILIREGEEIIFDGSEGDVLTAEDLPRYGQNGSDVNVIVYLSDTSTAVLRQLDFTSDGRELTLFLVTTSDRVLPEVKKLALDLGISIIIILVLTAIILIGWTYQGVVPQLRYLVRCTEEIREGTLDRPIEFHGNNEISELARALEEMRKRLQADALEKIDNEQEQKALISNIAHDLKTPITAVKGYAEGILDGVASTPEKKEAYLRTICNKANEMNSLINELSLYSKIDTNRIPYNFQRLNANQYFRDCAEEIGIDLENQQVSFNYYSYVEPDVEIIGDPEQLERVIHNIVGNSVKYQGNEPLRIQLRMKDVGDFVQIELEDNGMGIAAKDLPYIFDRMFRADASRNSKTGGSGIGLSIVKKIVEDHGGNIWATSKEHMGTCMYFVIRKYQEGTSNE